MASNQLEPAAAPAARNGAAGRILTTLALIAASIACSKNDAPAGDTSDPAPTFGGRGTPVTIGVAGPITGQYASLGKQVLDGSQQAVADLNAAGGVLGRPVVLKIGDDTCDPKLAVAVANQMVQSEVAFVAGHFCSGSAISASKVYEEERILNISPAATNPQLTDEGGDNIFRICGRDDQQGQVAGDFLARSFKDKNIAIIHDKTAYGKGLADTTRTALERSGVTPVLYEAFGAGENDYTALVGKLEQHDVDVVYHGGYHTEAGLIIRQMREQNMSTIMMAGDALNTQEFWSITGEAGAGTLITFSPDPRQNPSAASVVEVFRASSIEPEGYVLATYAAIQAWAQAVEQAQSLELDKVIEAMRTTELDTVIGKLSFDKNGDVTAPGYVIYEWNDGMYAYHDGANHPGK